MKPYPKSKREVSKKYLEYIKTLPCAGRDHSCTGDVVPHHTITKGAGGSDYLTIPLCYTHHQRVHNYGITYFQLHAGICIADEITKNLVGYIKKMEGE